MQHVFTCTHCSKCLDNVSGTGYHFRVATGTCLFWEMFFTACLWVESGGASSSPTPRICQQGLMIACSPATALGSRQSHRTDTAPDVHRKWAGNNIVKKKSLISPRGGFTQREGENGDLVVFPTRDWTFRALLSNPRAVIHPHDTTNCFWLGLAPCLFF